MSISSPSIALHVIKFGMKDSLYLHMASKRVKTLIISSNMKWVTVYICE